MHSFDTICAGVFIVGFLQFIRAEEYTLNTPIGDITGLVKNVAGEYTVTEFLGIPFAEPPVGDLRFKKPVPKPLPLSSPFNATRFGPACTQFSLESSVEKSEDCLYLNVYVPYNMTASGRQENKRPVMIWIYGGSFVNGGANFYDGSILGSYGDVIIVTLNYRLAILGFLTSGDALLPGNLGLWDQHLAIKWVHENIEAFGGDAGRVTIFGESAGSASVVYQCFYPGNMGLFHAAIAQSGSSAAPWAYTDKQTASFNVGYLAGKFGCTQSDAAGILECLKQVPAEQFDGPDISSVPVLFTPVLDGEFVLDTPSNIMYGRSAASNAYAMFNSIDLMTGFTSGDGLLDTATIMNLFGITDRNDFKLTKTQYDSLILQYLNYITKLPTTNNALRLATINEYSDWTDPFSETKRNKQITDFLTESLFAAPTIMTANLHANGSAGSTYVYEFAVRPIKHYIAVPPPLDGDDVMNHADDLVFVFGDDLDRAMTEDKYNYLLPTYRATMTLWTNFAKSGNPNLPRDVSSMINSTWPDYSTEEGYIRLTTDMSPESVKTRVRPRTMNFWINVVPTLVDVTSMENVPRDDKTVTVTTPVGDIVGMESYVPFSEESGYRVASYRGIPYAEAPVGNRRFQKPVAKAPFDRPYNATQYGPACRQPESTFGQGTATPKSEDCLLLNVFVPRNSVRDEPTGKAVMIWIHGGGLLSGESNSFDPRVLVGYGDVIVVTINYRLGFFGFVTTIDNVIPSNLGLWDQHTAIRWVHDNIAAFGGDPNRVTVFGVSAGASAVAYQMFYPGNRGLFHRAIAQSGVFGTSGSYMDVPTAARLVINFAQVTGCSISNTTTFLRCLQSKPIADLQNAINGIAMPNNPLPTRDNIFVLDTPQNILSGLSQESIDMFRSIDFQAGFTNNDGLLLAGAWQASLGQFNPLTFTLSRSDYENILVTNFLNTEVGRDSTGFMKRSAIHEYTDWADPESEKKRAQQLVSMHTDASFVVPAVRASDLHGVTTNRSTYMYKFSVRPITRSPPIPPLFEGPNVMSHTEDVQYVMGTNIAAVSDSTEYHQQYRVHRATMDMWSNFAKSGNPNTPNDVTKYIYTSWPQYDSSRNYLEITEEVTQHAVGQRAGLKAVNFWSNLVPEASDLSQRLETCSMTTSGGQKLTSGAVAAILVTTILCLL